MAMQEQTTTKQNAVSETESEASVDISALSEKIDQLGNSTGWFESWGMYLAGVAVAIGVVAWGFQHMALSRSTQKDAAQTLLATEKERKALIELRERDERISAANEAAALATKEAAKLSERAAVLEKETAQLQIELAKAQEAAERARSVANAMVISDLGQLQTDLGKAGPKVPIELILTSNQIESRQLHAQLKFTLEQSWPKTIDKPSGEVYKMEGLHVLMRDGDESTEKSFDNLCIALGNTGMAVSISRNDTTVDAGRIRISVGPKPLIVNPAWPVREIIPWEGMPVESDDAGEMPPDLLEHIRKMEEKANAKE